MATCPEGILADQVGSQSLVDVLDGLEDALAEEAALSPSRSSRASWAPVLGAAAKHRRSAKGAVFEDDLYLQGRIAAAIEDLTGVQEIDRTHRWLVAPRLGKGPAHGGW